MGYVDGKFAAWTAEIEAWRAVTLSTSFGEAEALLPQL
jgi:hypothetical protein